MTGTRGAPATLGAALAALWAQLRLVVLDVETTNADDGVHVVEVGVVICRGGRRTSTWVARVNPGVPVDPASHAVHRITDDDLADEPPFTSVVEELNRRLRGVDGETVVLVGHNISYDVAALHREYARLGLTLPDLPVLDTARLPRQVGVRAAGRSLPALAAAVGVAHLDPHSARGDAEATADVVLALLERAAVAGHNDFDALRAAAMGAGAGSRTSGIRAASARRARPTDDEPAPSVELPPTHTAGHTEVPTEPVPATLAAWRTQLIECAQLRCPYTTDRVAAAALEPALGPELVRHEVEQVLTELLASPAATPGRGADPEPEPASAEGPDTPAVATLLGALGPLLAQLPTRQAALSWHDRWAPQLAPVGRCDRGPNDTPCPRCREGRTCGLDAWYRHLAAAARGTVTPASRKSFLHLTGADLGRGVLTTWLAAKRRRLAEATAWVVFTEHRDAGQYATAEMFARYAHTAGAREPRLVAAYANLLATPGSVEALERAVATCEEAFLSRDGDTDDAWAELAAKRGQLLGRLSRVRVRASGELDEDGNPVPTRRHHPEEPRRTRSRRFVVG